MAHPGVCPFCDYIESDHYMLLLHVETLHSEGESPFVVREGHESTTLARNNRRRSFEGPKLIGSTSNDGREDLYVKCPQEFCGEDVLLLDIDAHIDMHETEHTTLDDQEESETRPSRRGTYKTMQGVPGSDSGKDLPRSRKSRSITSRSNEKGWRSFLVSSDSLGRSGPSQPSNDGSSRRLGVGLSKRRRRKYDHFTDASKESRAGAICE